jgi:hypothetical protein
MKVNEMKARVHLCSKSPFFIQPGHIYQTVMKVLLTDKPNLAESFSLFPVLDDILWYLTKLGKI